MAHSYQTVVQGGRRPITKCLNVIGTAELAREGGCRRIGGIEGDVSKLLSPGVPGLYYLLGERAAAEDLPHEVLLKMYYVDIFMSCLARTPSLGCLMLGGSL
ncbi:hypothetical protein V3F56_05850 [Moorellaceae bacterium AZ2]